jgi:hypothetical protein
VKAVLWRQLLLMKIKELGEIGPDRGPQRASGLGTGNRRGGDGRDALARAIEQKLGGESVSRDESSQS